jgi:hypothetical protein
MALAIRTFGRLTVARLRFQLQDNLRDWISPAVIQKHYARFLSAPREMEAHGIGME